MDINPRHLLSKWGSDILAGISYSGIASAIKYFTQHFVDLGWTVTAAILVMLANHYGKKYLIPWIDSKAIKVKSFFTKK
jgi:hypothetical protein